MHGIHGIRLLLKNSKTSKIMGTNNGFDIKLTDNDDDIKNIFTLTGEEVSKVSDSDQLKLVERYPWIANPMYIKDYLTSMFIEEFIYEKDILHEGETSKYVEKNLPRYEDIRKESTHNGTNVIRYMATDLKSANNNQAVYVCLKLSIDSDNFKWTVQFKLFGELRDVITVVPCCSELFNRIFKKYLNINRLPSNENLAPELISAHILQNNHNQIERLPETYRNLEEEELKEKIHEDLLYSLDELRKEPWTALPISLNYANINNNFNNLTNPLGRAYLTQFAFPLFMKGKKDNGPYAAGVLSCMDADGNFNSNFEKCVKELNEAANLKHVKEINDFLVYAHCTYTLKTILSLEMVYEDSLFSLRGNKDGYWFRNFSTVQTYHGLILHSYNTINNRDYYFVKVDNSAELIYVTPNIMSNNDLETGDRVIVVKLRESVLKIYKDEDYPEY